MEVPKNENFIQLSELNAALMIVTHKPNIIDNGISSLHPAASLFKGVVDIKDVEQNFLNLDLLALKFDIKVKTVKECLLIDNGSLKELAFGCLQYELTKDAAYMILSEEDKEKVDKMASDEYKWLTINSMSEDRLFDIVLNNPRIVLKHCPINNGIEFVSIKLNPIGNLLFCRDQQIITRKGVVLGRFNASARELETHIMKQVWNNLGIQLIGEIPLDGRLEGGDFYTLKEDLALLGVGLRTNMAAAQYLMANDLLECNRFAIVIDDKDKSQERMHLDTVFNILDDRNVVLLNFKAVGETLRKDITRRVEVYERTNTKSGPFGYYIKGKTWVDFSEFLVDEGYKIVWVTDKEQSEDITNFLNIGRKTDDKYTIIAVNKRLLELVQEQNIDLNIEHLEFGAIRKMYGAIHCTTQVIRR